MKLKTTALTFASLLLFSINSMAGLILAGSGGADVTAPTLSTFVIDTDGDTWTFTYDENVTATDDGDMCDGYDITMSAAGALTFTYASGTRGSTNIFTCTGSATVDSGETITDGLNYTQGTIADTSTNALDTITDKETGFTNGSEQGEFAYLTTDCFDTGNDGDDLTTYAAWSTAEGSLESIEIDTADHSDAGPCTSGAGSSVLILGSNGTPLVVQRSLVTSVSVYTIAVQMKFNFVSNIYHLMLYSLDTGETNWLWEIGARAVNTTTGDLEFYSSATDPSALTVCSSCITEGTWYSFEIEINTTTDTAVIWFGGTEYNNSGSGWAVGDAFPAALLLGAWRSDNSDGDGIDSLRTYEAARQSGK